MVLIATMKMCVLMLYLCPQCYMLPNYKVVYVLVFQIYKSTSYFVVKFVSKLWFDQFYLAMLRVGIWLCLKKLFAFQIYLLWK